MANNDNNLYWYGIPGITMRSHGEWSDPEIEYLGVRVNAYIVEDAMTEQYNSDIEKGILPPDNEYGEQFERYMRDHAEDVYDLFGVAVENGAGDYESFEAADFVQGEELTASRYWFQGPNPYTGVTEWLTPCLRHNGKRTWLEEDESGFEMNIKDFSQKPQEIYKAFAEAYRKWALG